MVRIMSIFNFYCKREISGPVLNSSFLLRSRVLLHKYNKRHASLDNNAASSTTLVTRLHQHNMVMQRSNTSSLVRSQTPNGTGSLSMFGKQTRSNFNSNPSYGFGTSDRSNVSKGDKDCLLPSFILIISCSACSVHLKGPSKTVVR